MSKVKPTSYQYGQLHQDQLAGYYRESKRAADDNPEYLRVELVRDLVEEARRQLLGGAAPRDLVVVDVGCSIGTFAIELSKLGYRSIGVDFDESALEHAREFNRQEGTSAEFLNMDISNWEEGLPAVDVAVCADIFEHLHDDELGAFLVGLKRALSPRGCLVFHTLPGEYDFLFWRSRKNQLDLPWVMRPFAVLPNEAFSRMVRIAALSYDILRIALTKQGQTHKESIKRTGHPNPLTPARLTDILERSGYVLERMATTIWPCQVAPRYRDLFLSRQILHRSIYGIAVPPRPGGGHAKS